MMRNAITFQIGDQVTLCMPLARVTDAWDNVNVTSLECGWN